MNNAVINEEITLEFPESYRIMDDADLTRFFGSPRNMWGIYNEAQHTILTFSWIKPGFLAAALAGQNAVANNMERSMRNNLRGFDRILASAVSG